MTLDTDASTPRLNFIEQKIEADQASGRCDQTVATRFPPEPNGYLHIGHAKSICLNFGLARTFGGRCHLRFDDTNPTKEEQVYIDAIKNDIRWLGFDWGEHEYYASNYFDQLYAWAMLLIQAGKAYVDDQDGTQIRATRGNLTSPGSASPWRDRPIDENLDLFARMKAGDFEDGQKVLRAKIDMAHPNMNLRDPVLYRILHATHPRTGDAWCIYPMYDFAHGQSDWIEGITHSICTLEFEAHRPLYEWCLREIQAAGGSVPHATRLPEQTEFARLNVSTMMTSKRKLLALVEEGHVDDWNDPRMPTLSGMRRRGYTAAGLRKFCDTIGIAKRNNTIELALLEHCVREDLNKVALRRTAILDPLKVVLTNYPENQVEMRQAVNNPEDESAGTRDVPFSRELYIDRSDFMEEAPKKFFRLAPGKEVRLRFGYFITCQDVIKNDAGQVVELHCTYDPQTAGGQAPDGRKVKGTLTWVSAAQAIDIEVRLYDNLFTTDDPGAAQPDGDWRDNLNPDSLTIVHAKAEPAVADAVVGQPIQFERLAYFTRDAAPDAGAGKPVFNRTVTLKDTWAKQKKKG